MIRFSQTLSQPKLKQGILATIGNTPLVQLQYLYPAYNVSIFAKIESFNPGGSIKDRTAESLLVDAMKTGQVQRDTTIIESSSGNMAIGLAQLCLKHGLKLIVVVDPNVNPQTLKILKTYSAKIEMIDCIDDSSYLNVRLAKVQALLKKIPNSFWPNQYANLANPQAHYHTMREIAEVLHHDVDFLFAATSTCGTIMGCAEYIRQHEMHTKVVAVDALGSIIFHQKSGSRLIPGHGAGRASQLLDRSQVSKVIHVSDKQCISGCHHLLHKEAILAGGSSGAVVHAVGHMLPQIPDGSRCAMILCDSGERYLDTIYSPEWVEHNFGRVETEMTKLSEWYDTHENEI
ncbi:2,3-diaminopropionate biosynthesis protein SbnA [Reichenbachiella agarivorans]|uniref:N-(2-amino-2-carboxyethyl)-L-glutamate synthase n=1 Tax=Reichenbachiella agarivorans TaxID=2979464 RepID=A0ABY6CRP8_9BACT|nr:2,3-diaminopropionate biosynthesis protein SbnA [Reichenbachiella agarivorans]UXP33019.1 2,3-diaminopropionate biosynthesis protein SbnA [Reichenbachiella agarivorans]